MSMKTTIEIKPAKAGEANHDPPEISNCFLFDDCNRGTYRSWRIRSIGYLERLERPKQNRQWHRRYCVYQKRVNWKMSRPTAKYNNLWERVSHSNRNQQGAFICNLPISDDTWPSISSFGSSNRVGSMIPFRIVSDTFAPKASFHRNNRHRGQTFSYQSRSIPVFRILLPRCMPVVKLTLYFPRLYRTSWPHHSLQYQRQARKRRRNQPLISRLIALHKVRESPLNLRWRFSFYSIRLERDNVL